MASEKICSSKKTRSSSTNEVVNERMNRKRRQELYLATLSVTFVSDNDVEQLINERKPGQKIETKQKILKKRGEEEPDNTVEKKKLSGTKRAGLLSKREEGSEPRVKKRTSTKVIEYYEESAGEESDIDCGEKEICEKPSGLCDDEEVGGQQMCSFRTPKKRDGMLVKARQSASKLRSESGMPKGQTSSKKSDPSCTPNSVLTPRSDRTPQQVLTPVQPKSSGKAKTPLQKTPAKSTVTPKRIEMIAKETEIIINKTPYLLRARNKRAMQAHMRAQEAVSDSEDSDYEGDSTSESDSSGDEEEERVRDDDNSSSDSGKGSQEPASRRSLRFQPMALVRRQPVKDSNYVFTSDEYFESHANKCVTSDRRLSRLATPRLPPDRLRRLLNDPVGSSGEHVLCTDFSALFSRWMFALSQGFNVLVYGLGSKMKILQGFQSEMLPQSRVLVVNGFFPSISIKEVMDTLTQDVLGWREAAGAGGAQAAVDRVEHEGRRGRGPRVFIIVHNIDGEALRSERVQRTLCRLAALPRVHLIASIDHINAPLLWDQWKLAAYNWLWQDATTFAPYTHETSYEGSLMVERAGGLALSSLLNVYRALTRNSRAIFQIILDRHQHDPKAQGTSFSELYSVCREEMLVTSDLVLRTVLTEFLDHEMVKYRKDGEHLYVPSDPAVLLQFSKIVAQDDS